VRERKRQCVFVRVREWVGESMGVFMCGCGLCVCLPANSVTAPPECVCM